MHTGRSPDPTPSAPMTEADEPEMDLVQKLFEKSLGPPRSCNDIPTSRASSHGAPWREAEEIKFKVARGRALDYQVVPSTGALVGLSYVPARLPSHSAQRKGQLPAPAQPAHSTLWALLQPHSGLGINTALSVVDSSGGRQSGFSSWCQQGFLDVTPRASLEYSLTQHPGSNLTAEADLIATLPKLPLLPQLTARHKLVAALSTPGVQHGSTLSMPLLGGGAVARVQVQEPAAGSLHAGSVLSVSLEGRNNSSRGLAGGVSLSPSLSSAFKGSAFATTSGALSCSGGGSSSSHGEGSSRAGSDSDDDGGGSGGSMADRHRRRQVPGLRLQMQPGAVRSWEDVSGRWQQPWGSRLKSTLQYQAQQRRWGLDLCQKLGSSLTAAGSLSWEGPASLAAPADDEETACGTAAARQLLRHVVSYGRGSQPRRAALKLVCCLPASMPGGAKSRRRLQLETAYDLDAGLATHGLKLRLGGRGGNAAHLQRQRYDLAVTKRQRQVDVTLDFFAPL